MSSLYSLRLVICFPEARQEGKLLRENGLVFPRDEIIYFVALYSQIFLDSSSTSLSNQVISVGLPWSETVAGGKPERGRVHVCKNMRCSFSLCGY